MTDCNGCTPLHLAAAFDLEGRCIEYLLDHCLDANKKDNRGYTPIHYAVLGGNQVGLKHLLACCDRINNETLPKMTPLHIAAYYGYNEILRLLLPFFINTNIKDDSGE